jgi:hypothetical protein
MAFVDQLSFILEEQSNVNLTEEAARTASELEAVRRKVVRLEQKLRNITRQMSRDLALKIRKNNSGLNIAVDNVGCKIGIGARVIELNPNITRNKWSVRGDQAFVERWGDLSLDKNPVPYILEFFDKQQINEDVGLGANFLDGKRVSLCDLARSRESSLNSRLSR